MSKQLEILKNEVDIFQKDASISGVLLNGSVAYGTATETSDLDIIVLCEKDELVNQYVDGILVEIHFHTFETMMERLKRNPTEVYRYIYAKVQYDTNGKLNEIMQAAQHIYENYITPSEGLKNIAYWLTSTKMKLETALQAQDALKVAYLLATNTWEVLEGVWAVNNKPMPPSGLAFFCHKELEKVPCENWFVKLLTGEAVTRARFMIKVIDWFGCLAASILDSGDNGHFDFDARDNGHFIASTGKISGVEDGGSQ